MVKYNKISTLLKKSQVGTIFYKKTK